MIVSANTFMGRADEARNAWVASARCRSSDPDELFVSGAAQRKAAVICRRCPVMTECAADALDNRMEFGVWGGLTERQRRVLLKRHPGVISWADFFAAQREHRNAGQRASHDPLTQLGAHGGARNKKLKAIDSCIGGEVRDPSRGVSATAV